MGLQNPVPEVRAVSPFITHLALRISWTEKQGEKSTINVRTVALASS